MEVPSLLLELSKDDNPFHCLAVSGDWKKLHALSERTECCKCKKSRKYFCYSCLLPVSEISDFVPRLKLPLKVDIIKHCREIEGKSTSVHAAIIAPDDVTLYTYPCIPNYNLIEKVLLIFPSESSVSVEDAVNSFAKGSSDQTIVNDSEMPLSRVVFIDSTWNQCKGIFKDPRITNIPCAVLKGRSSQFWRHQKGSPRWHLATIEAIHQFFIEYSSALHRLSLNDSCPYLYNGQFDNLLFFFRFMYDKIHSTYEHDTLLAYKRNS